MALAAALGKLAPVEQVKLLGLRWALRKLKHDPECYEWMSHQVSVVGGGHPSRQAVRQFFARVDEVGEKQWHPGMRSEDVGRPKEVRTSNCNMCLRESSLGRPPRKIY